ncbi:hypothetical protein C9I98_00705 [Photobacterium sanctipauli]|uniref:Uncharacterized protein n=1 Tax=Photobacterium sanctipauli TaxID=1342794 RepID=A0A2T3NZW7_9GAMM|nr:hypothetical protein [Photobacterium sanctipauli]PSW21821.1 hypothetical protein C9I98_00705 [Photobacterium sanctipauli]
MSNFEYQLYCRNCRRVTLHKRQVIDRTDKVSPEMENGYITSFRRFINLCFGEPLDKKFTETSADICTVCGSAYDKTDDSVGFSDSGHD